MEAWWPQLALRSIAPLRCNSFPFCTRRFSSINRYVGSGDENDKMGCKSGPNGKSPANRRASQRHKKPPPQAEEPPAQAGSTPPRIGWLRRTWNLIAGFFAALLTISGLLALFLPPSVATPSPIVEDDPLAIPIEITNENVLPIFNVQYRCVLLEVKSANVDLSRNSVGVLDTRVPRLLWGKEKMTARCDHAFSAKGLRWKELRFRLTLRYFPFFPIRWTKEYTFTAALDTKGNFQRWLIE